MQTSANEIAGANIARSPRFANTGESVGQPKAPWTTHFQQLENAGGLLPPPDSLKDEELTASPMTENPTERKAAR
jgi:hypothetical protein